MSYTLLKDLDSKIDAQVDSYNLEEDVKPLMPPFFG
jgi:hypothetical protein